VPITVTYANPCRASHFRPVVDIARIVRMVALRLLGRGLYLPGLLRSLEVGRADRGRSVSDPAARHREVS
jgi:hypothetical protein